MDGEYPDWIELKNNEAVSLNLTPTNRRVRWTNTSPAGAGFDRLRVE